MSDQWDRQSPPRLVGYESWLYQMPYFDSSGDVFVSVALPGYSIQNAIAQAPDGAASVGQSILETIRRFGQGRKQMDDVTLLCVGRPATRPYR
jgi:hypothetical protein